MKTKILLIIASIIFHLSSLSADTIPNSGFESWVSNIWTEDPAFWMTNNSSLLAPTIVKDSDSYSGNLAMMLINNGAFQPLTSCGFQLATHPIKVNGYVKNTLGSGDSTVFSIYLFNNDQVVDSGQFIFWGGINPNYTPFEIPISQNSVAVDSCLIVIQGGMSYQASITFDELQLSPVLGIPSVNEIKYSVSPNPCKDFAVLKSEYFSFHEVKIEAFDVTGRKVEILFEKKQADDYIVELNTASLNPGLWLISVRDEDRVHTIRLVKME